MDSKTETVSDNAMIAEFMAAKNHINESERKEYLLLDAPKGFSGDCWYEVGNVRYHISWDWLMPVVDTIEEIEEPHPSNNPEKGTVWPYQFEILSRSIVQIIDNRNDNAIVTINQDGLTRIQAVYKAVVEFIRWYNNSQSPDTIK